MQIDMHFGGTYILARLAGFPANEAATIANAAQYVDDARHTGFVRFKNGALFQRTATVHRMASTDNVNECANHLAWLPFHFLPGNNGLPAGQGVTDDYAQRLLCRPDSAVARDMVADCIADRDQPQSLHRLGITAHVLLDTYAHQRFGGFIHPYNWVGDIEGNDPAIRKSIAAKLLDLFGDICAHPTPMLGHGMALAYPDLPWLTWSYKDGLGTVVQRDNPDIFMDGLDQLYRVFLRYRCSAEEEGLPSGLAGTLRGHLSSITAEDGEARLGQWLSLLAGDAFGFGAETVSYDAPGWREKALNDKRDFDFLEKFEDIPELDYPVDFLRSDWKLFHDTAKDHRHAVIQRILPRYGLCAA